MPGVSYLLSDQYQYAIRGDNLTIAFASFGNWHTGVAIPLQWAIDLHQKLGESLADTIRRQTAPEPTPTSEKPND